MATDVRASGFSFFLQIKKFNCGGSKNASRESVPTRIEFQWNVRFARETANSGHSYPRNSGHRRFAGNAPYCDTGDSSATADSVSMPLKRGTGNDAITRHETKDAALKLVDGLA
jgi:hypothetical protein